MNALSRPGRSPAALFTLALLTLVNAGAVVLVARALGAGQAPGSSVAKVGLGVTLVLAVLFVTLAARLVFPGPLRDDGAARQGAGESPSGAGSPDTARGRDRFLRRLAQELRRPVVAALTDLHTLRTSEAAGPAAAEASDRIERSLRQQTRMIGALEEASRPVQNHPTIPVSPVELTDLLDRVVDAYRGAIEERGLRVQRSFHDHEVTAMADGRRLEQAVGALLSNAAKFTPPGGMIRVGLTTSDSRVVISVSDTGTGFAPEISPLLFDPILRENALDGPVAGGPGLGLAMASRIVQRQGGTLTAHSDGPGQGATFRVTLSRSRSSAVPDEGKRPQSFAGSDDRPAVTLGRLEQVRILIVDDESVISESLQVLLEACGADVRSASSATQARRVFEVWRPDVVIADLGMPGEDGYGLLASIRRRTELAGGTVPVIALTGRDDVEEQFKTLSAGFQVYLTKPADPRELLAVVRDLTHRSVPSSNERG